MVGYLLLLGAALGELSREVRQLRDPAAQGDTSRLKARPVV